MNLENSWFSMLSKGEEGVVGCGSVAVELLVGGDEVIGPGFQK